jgi:hypothetical protein
MSFLLRIALPACLVFGLLSACLLSACAAPATSDTVPQAQAGTKPLPRMSNPLPATRAPGTPDLGSSCKVDADCVVKDVGNCCGTMPACVNKDAKVDPAAVQAQCRQQGRMSVCGFRAISACSCNAGRCESADGGNPMRRRLRPAEPTP